MDTLHIRWSIRRDLPEILAIERASFGNPWTEQEFRDTLMQRHTIAMAAEYGDTLVGYMVYRMNDGFYTLLNLAVHPSHRRSGIGSALVRKLVSKLPGHSPSGPRNRITLEVSESNLTGQLFYRSLGFRAVEVLRDYYTESEEDGYVMEYRLPVAADVPNTCSRQ